MESLKYFPAVAILGPRQCGKSTLVKTILKDISNTLYLDLERLSDRQKLTDPELFPVLRSLIDENRESGRFLVLGSASRDLIRQSSESLAGRIAHLELTPFLYSEVDQKGITTMDYLLRGGFPDSLLANNEKISRQWRENFISTFLERDIPQLGFSIPARTLERLWSMCAHVHGQPLNQSQLGQSLGVSHTTIRSYLDLLAGTFMLRILPPLLPNLKKRLIKSPRLFLRDSGILHSLLGLTTLDDLMGHPLFGASWEGMVIENLLTLLPEWKGYYYRTAAGAELDLVLERGRKRIAVECKASLAPTVSRGFHSALRDLKISEAYVIAPVDESYPIEKGIQVSPLLDVVSALQHD